MLALIAGAGWLPDHIVVASTMPVLVTCLDGFTPDRLEVDVVFRVERLGSFIADLQSRGVTDICMAGSIGRPKLDPSMIDAATLPMVPRMMQALSQGDDGALRIVIALFEEAGFTLRAAHEICPDLLPQSGTPTKAQPGPAHQDAARFGQSVVADMGRADQGQACVIRRADVLAREDASGTDAMLARLSAGDGAAADGDLLSSGFNSMTDAAGVALDWLGGIEDNSNAGAILFKAPKPDQDRRVDLPTIGPVTAQGAVAAGLDGIVIAAGGVIVLDLSQVIRILDKHGLFLWIRPA